MKQRFPNKLTEEKLVLGFEFTAELNVGETLTGTPTVTASAVEGTDAAPSGLLNGAAQISDGTVLVPVKDGVEGVTYAVRVIVATTNAAKVLGLVGKVTVEA
jgi:hypothetical protein